MELLLGGAEIRLDGEEVDLAFGAPLARAVGKAVIEADGLAGALARHDEAAAAGGGEHGLGNEAHAQRGKCCIEGVAAILQDLRGGGGGQPVARGNDALLLLHADRARCTR